MGRNLSGEANASTRTPLLSRSVAQGQVYQTRIRYPLCCAGLSNRRENAPRRRRENGGNVPRDHLSPGRWTAAVLARDPNFGLRDVEIANRRNVRYVD